MPVLASRMDGNVGLLGSDYAGYFPVGDTKALARLLLRLEREPRFVATLGKALARRTPLFRAGARDGRVACLLLAGLGRP